MALGLLYSAFNMKNSNKNVKKSQSLRARRLLTFLTHLKPARRFFRIPRHGNGPGDVAIVVPSATVPQRLYRQALGGRAFILPFPSVTHVFFGLTFLLLVQGRTRALGHVFFGLAQGLLRGHVLLAPRPAIQSGNVLVRSSRLVRLLLQGGGVVFSAVAGLRDLLLVLAVFDLFGVLGVVDVVGLFVVARPPRRQDGEGTAEGFRLGFDGARAVGG